MRPHRSILSLLPLLLLVGVETAVAQCPSGEIAEPASFTGTVRPATVVDLDPSADVVEVRLTARVETVDFGSGNQTEVWTYNGITPGPMIEAEVGNTLIVHFCNDLPQETTIHWHGIETPADMDGSHISQLTVPPGGTFRYEFPLLHAGTFWYHPHFRTHEQVEKGLYGALLVRDPEGEAELGLPTREHVLMLDDILLDETGQLREPFSGTKEQVAIEQLNGREGTTVLLNGVVRPTLALERGVAHRVRMINAANARFMRMSIPDVTFWRIGGDQGLIEAPIEVEPVISNNPPPPPASPRSGTEAAALKHTTTPDAGVFLSPGERADLIFFPTGDDALEFTWYDTQRGRHSVIFEEDGTVILGHDLPDGNQHDRIYADIELFGDSTATEYTPPAELAVLEAIDTTDAPELPFVLGHTVPDWQTGEVTFFFQGPGLPFMALTPDDVHTVDIGGTYVWSVTNLTGGMHNFHTHGWSFQHIETEYVDMDVPDNNRIEPASHLEWKDTFILPGRPGMPMRSRSISRFAVHFSDTGRENQAFAGGRTPTEDASGGWLAHCHIFEHSARGMMTYFQTSGIFADGFESGGPDRWQLPPEKTTAEKTTQAEPRSTP